MGALTVRFFGDITKVIAGECGPLYRANALAGRLVCGTPLPYPGRRGFALGSIAPKAATLSLALTNQLTESRQRNCIASP